MGTIAKAIFIRKLKLSVTLSVKSMYIGKIT